MSTLDVGRLLIEAGLTLVAFLVFVGVGIPLLDAIRGRTYQFVVALLGFALMVTAVLLLAAKLDLAAALAAALAVGVISRLTRGPSDRVGRHFGSDAHLLLRGMPDDPQAGTALLARLALVARRLSHSAVESMETWIDIREVSDDTIRYDVEKTIVLPVGGGRDIPLAIIIQPSFIDDPDDETARTKAPPLRSDEGDWVIRFWPHLTRAAWAKYAPEAEVSVVVDASDDHGRRRAVEVARAETLTKTAPIELHSLTFSATLSFDSHQDTVGYRVTGLRHDSRSHTMHFLAWHVALKSWRVEARVAKSVPLGIRLAPLTDPAIPTASRRPGQGEARLDMSAGPNGAAVVPSDSVVLALIQQTTSS